MQDEYVPIYDENLLLYPMNGIHRKIKQLRLAKELTQSDMAESLAISLKSYQNFENSITKLDFDRMNEVAKILEVDVEELINAEDSGVYIAEIKNNKIGYNGSEVTINESPSTNERELFEQIIAAKDAQIKLLTETNDLLQKLLASK